jgi:hypothetical protein
MIAETLWSWEDASTAVAADSITKLHQRGRSKKSPTCSKDSKKNRWDYEVRIIKVINKLTISISQTSVDDLQIKLATTLQSQRSFGK